MATKSKTSMRVPCPKCGAVGEDSGLRIYPFDLKIECADCGETIDRADLQQLIDDTAKLLRWLDAAESV